MNILPRRTRKKEERRVMAGVFIITGLWVTAAIILTVRCNEGAGGEAGGDRGRGHTT